ncbi:kelch motif family protein, putative [Ichthyophthirius multifiliis]|uniref:Kelch motif family protein, putative n=1 Tax=Ichthyophthirius multifiliis TaxID=5932 RepID=G0QTH5_ICHMU|nr:kelch motif family protein, putative [Ichthyophthirius multifiliis]EGR31478.1 kelch motif family protein, putative [Ichthyophthirius multifiliis]|eukprot:XP_004034964.1 kelch motif family protein, putative [Ichthyophthirius multifiliis]
MNKINNQIFQDQNYLQNPYLVNQSYTHKPSIGVSRLTQQTGNPSPINNVNQSQVFSQQCIYHPEMIITNFCKKSLMPLCPKCITNYLKTREQANQPVEIENIDKVQLECKEAVQELEELYTCNLQKLRDVKEKKINIHNSLSEKILFAKNKVIKLVDSFFENLERDLNQQLMIKQNQFEKELSMAENFAVQKQQELNVINQKLDGPKCLKHILRLLNENYFSESQKYHKECELFIQMLNKKSADVITNDNSLYNLNIEMAKFISIKNSELILTDVNNQKSNNNNSILNQYTKQELQPVSKQNIVNRNYFDQLCHQKYIHYFQPQTNDLYLLDISNIINDKQIINPTWQKIPLEIGFKILHDHSSIITPQGDIYICGGIDTNSMQVSNECFKVNLKYRTLEKKTSMKIQRFLHSVVYLNNALYALGGFDQNHQILDKCERWNFSENQWLRIAPMVGQGAQMGVCTFKSKYIIAFSVAVHPKVNLLQQYDPLFDTWQEIMVSLESNLINSEFLIRPLCGIVQINDNGTLLIFGGDEQSREQNMQTPNNYVFTLKSDIESLNFSVGVGRNQVELYNCPINGASYCQNGKIYTISKDREQSKLIVFSNQNWIKQQ